MQKLLKGKKTYIISGLMFLVALVNFLAGDASWTSLLQADAVNMLLSLLPASIRAALGGIIEAVAK